jgi:hypothetical protein
MYETADEVCGANLPRLTLTLTALMTPESVETAYALFFIATCELSIM